MGISEPLHFSSWAQQRERICFSEEPVSVTPECAQTAQGCRVRKQVTFDSRAEAALLFTKNKNKTKNKDGRK